VTRLRSPSKVLMADRSRCSPSNSADTPIRLKREARPCLLEPLLLGSRARFCNLRRLSCRTATGRERMAALNRALQTNHDAWLHPVATAPGSAIAIRTEALTGMAMRVRCSFVVVCLPCLATRLLRVRLPTGVCASCVALIMRQAAR
jgi:hypothetical protein